MATHETDIVPRPHLGRDDGGRPLSAGEFADAIFDEPRAYERVAEVMGR